MRQFSFGLLLLSLALVVADPASAQRRGAGAAPGQQGGRFQQGQGQGQAGIPLTALLMNQEVQQELGLTSEQVKNLEQINGQMQSEMRSMLQQMRQGGQAGGDPRQIFQQMGQARERLTQQAQQAMSKVLDQGQKVRANQIYYQAQGIRAFFDPAVSQKLKLSRDQRQQIQQITRTASEEMRAAFQELRPEGGQPGQGRRQRGQAGEEANQPGAEGRQALAGRLRTFQQETLTKTLAVLTDEQKTTWNEIIGEPFDLPQNIGRGGFAGGRPGQAGNAGGRRPGGAGGRRPGGADGRGGNGGIN